MRHEAGADGRTRNTRAIAQAYMDHIIADPEGLRILTRMTPEMFDYTCHLFAGWMVAHRDRGLFWEDEIGRHDPANHSVPYPWHIVLMALVHKGHVWENAWSMFLTDPPLFRRYMALANEVLAGVLPTARNLGAFNGAGHAGMGDGAKPAGGEGERPDTGEGGGTPPLGGTGSPPAGAQPPAGSGARAGMTEPASGRRVSAPRTTAAGTPADPPAAPGTRMVIILDRIRVRADGTGDHSRGDIPRSGGKGAPVFNTTIMVGTDGTIIGLGRTTPGYAHALARIRDDLSGLGALADAMFDPDTPPERRPIIVVDLGYRGLQEYVPGAEVLAPVSGGRGSDPGAAGLSQADRDHNAKISGAKKIAERAIWNMKRYDVLRKPFGGTPDQLNEEMNVISGLVNLRHGWPETAAKKAGLLERVTAWRRGE